MRSGYCCKVDYLQAVIKTIPDVEKSTVGGIFSKRGPYLCGYKNKGSMLMGPKGLGLNQEVIYFQ